MKTIFGLNVPCSNTNNNHEYIILLSFLPAQAFNTLTASLRELCVCCILLSTEHEESSSYLRSWMNAGHRQPLRLAATKSRMGHAEPAAGGVGICNIAMLLRESTSLPISHLREVELLTNGDRYECQQTTTEESIPALAIALSGAEVQPFSMIMSFLTGISSFHMNILMR